MKPNIHVFFHCLIDRPKSREVIAEIQAAHVYSGLYQHATTLNAITVGQGDTTGLFMPKWIVTPGGSADQYEFPTLKSLWRRAQDDPDSYLLYHHTKSTSRTDSLGRIWCRLLTHGCIGRWRECVSKLDQGIDAAGVFLTDSPYRHMVGNFWWIKASAVKDLQEPGPTDEVGGRFWAEFWALSGGATAIDINTEQVEFSKLYRSGLYLETPQPPIVHPW